MTRSNLPALCLILTLAHPVAGLAQQPSLTIVVISGEDAVNVVQRRTAVAPVIEVRDANNLPVAGASVTFSVRTAGATFGNGVPTLSVVTNAAGQAAATGLTPTAAGALEIQAAASFQGQVATALITQTNVATAAAAAPATAAAGSGSAGGGMSGTTLGIVGAAAGGAAIAATQLGGEEPAATATAPPPPPAPTRTTYSATYTGQGQTSNIADNPADFVTCVETLTLTGTLTMSLTQEPTGTITGTASTVMRRTDTAVSSACPAGMVGQSSTVTWEIPVTGTVQSVQFSGESPIVSNLQPGSRTLKFTGRIENGTVVGTVVWSEAFGGLTSGERQLRFTARGSSTFDVSLRP